MTKLIRLELYKNGKGHSWRAFLSLIIVALACAGFFSLILYEELTAGMLEMASAVIEASELIEIQDVFATMHQDEAVRASLVQMVSIFFVIFAGAKYASYVVADFKNQQIEQMYVYPIPRGRILLAKVATAALLTFLGALLAYFLGIIAMYIGMGIPVTGDYILRVVLASVTIPLLGLFAMLVGLWRKSTVAAIVTAVILVTVTSGNFGAFTLSNFPIVGYSLAVIGLIATVVKVKQLKYADCLQ